MSFYKYNRNSVTTKFPGYIDKFFYNIELKLLLHNKQKGYGMLDKYENNEYFMSDINSYLEKSVNDYLYGDSDSDSE